MKTPATCPRCDCVMHPTHKCPRVALQRKKRQAAGEAEEDAPQTRRAADHEDTHVSRRLADGFDMISD